MHSSFVTLNGVPTRVATWGKWIEESFDANEPKDLVIFIPGNPGVTKYYAEFLRLLHEKLGWPVWCMGHAGHERPENEELYNIPDIEDHPELYTLEAQVKQKVEFFEKYVPNNVRVHLIGHSVGTYIITKLIKIPSINDKIVKNYLLFPTVEYIGDTPNGKIFTTVVERIVWITLLLAGFFTLLPHIIQYFLIYIWTLVSSVPKLHIETIIKFVDPVVLKRVFFMASDEMRKMKERETEAMRANVDRIKVYFGKTDGWGPVSYCDRLKKDIPEINTQICELGITHAFCLRRSDDMANMVADWIREGR